jgi:putative membrane protein
VTPSRRLAIALLLVTFGAACSREASEPAMTQTAPDDSTYNAAAGRSEDPGSATLGGMPQDFVREAVQTDMLEIQAGRLAAEKAKSSEVREFASRLVADHGAASRQLEQIAQARGVQVPQSLPADKQQALDSLQEKSGTEFDRAFAKEMVQGHEEAVRMFEQAAQNAADPEVKAFAARQLPKLREHLKLAQALPAAERG